MTLTYPDYKDGVVSICDTHPKSYHMKIRQGGPDTHAMIEHWLADD